jgi:D-3-phosphoglycerate dehydrogenase
MRREEILFRLLNMLFRFCSPSRKNPASRCNLAILEIWESKKSRRRGALQQDARVIGMVGSGKASMSRRAICFGMRVIAYDPYLSATRARSLQVESSSMSWTICLQLLISFHCTPLPLTPETRHILDAGRLQRTKRGVRYDV